VLGVLAILVVLSGAVCDETKGRLLEAAGRAALKGRVVYDRKEPPIIEELRPTTSREKCPELVRGKGWYVDEKSKGVGHALVLLRPPKGYVLPAEEKRRKPEKRVLSSIECQFRPRALLIGPGDRFEFQNTDSITVHLIMTGPHVTSRLVPPGKTCDEIILRSDDNEPILVRSSVHNWMSAYIWSLSHPYAATTDANGDYAIDDLPIIEGEHQPSLWIWHEMLPGDHFLEIGKLKLENGKTTVKDIPVKD
jgi:hypothetical protein